MPESSELSLVSRGADATADPAGADPLAAALGRPTRADGSPVEPGPAAPGETLPPIGQPVRVVVPPPDVTPTAPPAPTAVPTAQGLAVPQGIAGVVDAAAPPEGLALPRWDGDPDKEVMPGEIVYYWHVVQGGYMVPVVMLVLGRLATGAYEGKRWRPPTGSDYPIALARPSRVPKLGHFTPWGVKFPPALCLAKPPGSSPP